MIANIIAASVVIAIVGLAVFSLVRKGKKKNCGCGCSHCSSCDQCGKR